MIRRVVDLTLRPSEAFKGIAAKPSFLAPLVLTTALLAGLIFFALLRIGADRLFAPVPELLQRSPELAGQPREIVVEAVALVVEAGVLVIVPVAIPLTAASLLPVIWGLGARASFRPMLAVTAWAALPPALGTFLSGAVVFFVRDPARLSFDSLMPFNLGVLVPGKLVHNIAGSVELFSLWSIVLLAHGMAAVSGITFRRCFLAIAIPLFLAVWFLMAIGAMLL